MGLLLEVLSSAPFELSWRSRTLQEERGGVKRDEFVSVARGGLGALLPMAGQVLYGGARPAGADFDKGSYYLPTVIEGLPNSARMCQEEIFGPVLALLPWRDEADLLAQCNDNVFGLASGIWTRDYKTAWRIGRALQTGTVWINTYKQLSIATPFGGFKESGLGREKGVSGVRLYQQTKGIYLGFDE